MWTTIDYLEDRIAGDKAIQRLNISIESGRREEIVRKSSMPFVKTEGIKMAALIGGRRSSAKRAKLREQVENTPSNSEKDREGLCRVGSYVQGFLGYGESCLGEEVGNGEGGFLI